MKVNFVPLSDNVLLKAINGPEMIGRIVIPDAAKEEELVGEVISIGPGKRDQSGKIWPVELQIGQRVLFQRYSGFDVELEAGEKKDKKGIKTKFRVIEEGDILGIIL